MRQIARSKLARRTVLPAALALLMALAAPGVARSATPATPSPAPAHVPANFLWGVTTAGHQYEGGDVLSNWARWIAQGHGTEPNRQGARGYGLYNQDLDLARGMGLNAWRMSLEWSRIEPREGHIDWAEVAHYHEELASIKAHGMTPLVTLMHFAYPAWLDTKGGWSGPNAVKAYTRYVTFVAKEFGPQVQWYLTFNEPNMLVQGAYQQGVFPPGKHFAWAEGYNAFENILTAHRAAYAVLHAARPDAKVSFNLYATRVRIFGIQGEPEIEAPPERWLLLQALGGHGRPSSLDYACLDYYCRTTLAKPQRHEAWEVYPAGLTSAVEDYHRWTGLPVLVAENGLATWDGAPRRDGWTRSAYIVAHVQALQQAMAEGVPVLGYFHWSITDNYEWGSYSPRFGLYRVEARSGDFKRVPTDGVAALAAIAGAGGVTPAIATRFGPAPHPTR